MSSELLCEPLSADENIGNVLLIPAAIFIIPSTATTALRLWARRKSLGSDDWTILIAAILTIVLNALSIVGVKHGKGRHVCALDEEAVAEIGRYSWINQIILFWALFFIKISVCLLVLRVKSTALLRWTSGIVTALMIISTIVACVALLAECRPVSAYWDRSSGECRAPTFRIYSIWVQATISVFTDLVCSLLPFPILWSLQLSPRKKIAVGVLMALGTIAFVFAIMRATSLSLGLSDTTYDYTLTGTWMTLEVNIGLIASNIGPMHALLFKRGKPQASYAYGTQDHASNVRRSRTATRLHANENDSDHSLVQTHSDGRGKETNAHESASYERTSNDIALDRVESASSRRSLKKSVSKW